MRPFSGPPLPRLEQRDALRRAAACERPHAAQRKNVGPSECRLLPVPFVTRTSDCSPSSGRPYHRRRDTGVSSSSSFRVVYSSLKNFVHELSDACF